MLLVEQRHCHVSKVEATQVPDSLTPGIFANPFARAAKSPGLGNTSNSYLPQKHLDTRKPDGPSIRMRRLASYSASISATHSCESVSAAMPAYCVNLKGRTFCCTAKDRLSRHLPSFSYPKLLEFFMFPSLLTEMTLESMKRSSTWLHRKADICSSGRSPNSRLQTEIT